MDNVSVSVEELANALQLSVENPGRGVITVEESEINRPGLQLAGYFEHFASGRVQLIGNTEMSFINQLPAQAFSVRMQRFVEFNPPCIVFSRTNRPGPDLLEIARKGNVPVLFSDKATAKLSHAITYYIDRLLAPVITCHGVLLDIYGIGVMLVGESGIGKSETALELVKRGHRLVADDVLDIRRVADNRLSGTAPALTRHLMEIRGIGIIDIRYMFGVSAVIVEKSIDLVIEMEMWDEKKSYDRLGLDEQTTELLYVNVPRILVPVRPGRNLAIIVEVAARNYRLKKLGYDAAKEFDRRWMEELENQE
ncbi:MAG: HPr(Ser) kinase/phosphatase [Clostridiales bacterium]|jgi:HPr kinase/phosphorylase|nr:HPr(Ser) kinase/phosphatase [Clostridiales bacterium]